MCGTTRKGERKPSKRGTTKVEPRSTKVGGRRLPIKGLSESTETGS